jgi:replicative DNA helicase
VRLAGAAISAFAARDYAQMIYDLAVRRELIGLGRDISAKAAQGRCGQRAARTDRRGRTARSTSWPSRARPSAASSRS